MAIVTMKRLRLLAMREDREELLHTLQRLGCVELSEPTPQAGGEQEEVLLDSLSAPDTQALAQAQTRRQEAERAMEILRHYGIKGRGFLTPRPQTSQEELTGPEAAARQDRAVADVLERERQVHALQAQQEKLAAQRASLAPWLGLEVPLESASTRDMSVQFGTLTAARPLEEARQAAEAASELVWLQEASAGRELRWCLLVCHASALDGVLEALRDFGWSRISLEGWHGTARENDARLAREQERVGQELRQAQEGLSSMGDVLDDLCRAADRAALDLRLEEGRAKLRDTQQTFLLQGWVPAERWETVREALSRCPCAYELEDPAQEEYAQVPVQLKNNWFTRPLNMVTEMYSLPAYGSLDPNPLMAPFFILFYGIMLADMGYGLLMMLASVYVLKKVRPRGGMWNFFALMGLCGISTFVMGAVTGGFFGDFLTQLTTVMGMAQPIVLPALFTPLDDTMMILVGAMCLGFVQIVTGMAISVIEKIKAGNLMDALWEEITWWVVFAGLGLMALGVTNLVLCAGLVLVLAGPLVTGKGLGKITGIFSSLYNHITGYFGDILSYSRLMALMLAGSVIAQVFNTLGAIPGNVILFLIISLAGNTLNFALNLLGCYVHDLRLQCLEFFKNFYVDGGRPFRPLDRTTKYYDVVN